MRAKLQNPAELIPFTNCLLCGVIKCQCAACGRSLNCASCAEDLKMTSARFGMDKKKRRRLSQTLLNRAGFSIASVKRSRRMRNR
jgi:hypothetical protein